MNDLTMKSWGKTGWWFQPLWIILVNFNDYCQYMEQKKHVPNHQPDEIMMYMSFSIPWYDHDMNMIWKWDKHDMTIYMISKELLQSNQDAKVIWYVSCDNEIILWDHIDVVTFICILNDTYIFRQTQGPKVAPDLRLRCHVSQISGPRQVR